MLKLMQCNEVTAYVPGFLPLFAYSIYISASKYIQNITWITTQVIMLETLLTCMPTLQWRRNRSGRSGFGRYTF